jgi:uncharacterized membrane protein YphA (DoxX/SURF4 family)
MKNILILSTLLFFIMFVYSGINKIQNFNDKVSTLDTKLNSKLPYGLLNFAMVCVIALEILGPVIILLRIIWGKKSPKLLTDITTIVFILFILFMIVVTLIYHPFSFEKPIPFLSNCSTLAGFLFLFLLINIVCDKKEF